MPMHFVHVNENTIDFIKQVNGGVEPEGTDEAMENGHTYFIHADRLDDTDPNRLVLSTEFHLTYKCCECADDNCNIVMKR